MATRDAICFVIGALAGGLGVCLLMIWRQRAAGAADSGRAVSLIKLSHDFRGAITPALLMAERLEANKDPAVKQAAGVIMEAMDRATEIAKAASTEARAVGGVAKPDPRGR